MAPSSAFAVAGPAQRVPDDDAILRRLRLRVVSRGSKGSSAVGRFAASVKERRTRCPAIRPSRDKCRAALRRITPQQDPGGASRRGSDILTLATGTTTDRAEGSGSNLLTDETVTTRAMPDSTDGLIGLQVHGGGKGRRCKDITIVLVAGDWKFRVSAKLRARDQAPDRHRAAALIASFGAIWAIRRRVAEATRDSATRADHGDAGASAGGGTTGSMA